MHRLLFRDFGRLGMDAIFAGNLSKVYTGGKEALSDVSFSLKQGEVFGFLGPNGAGKTTMVKLLNGMLSPTNGACSVFGVDPAVEPEKMHGFAGVVTEHAQMYDHLSGLDNLIFYGMLFGLSRGESRKKAQALLERLDLSDTGGRKLSGYSTGMRQRLSLARALIHQPKILFLDEPTSGLDPESAQSVNQLIRGLAKEEGCTVFLCTHQLRYAQELCTSYGLIDEGRLLAAGTLDALRERVFSGLTVQVRADVFPRKLPFRMTGEGSAEIEVQSEDEVPALVRSIIEAGGNVYHVSSDKMSLEEIYFSLLEKSKGRKGAAK